MTTVRMEDRLAVQKELETVKPTHVFNCAGVTGRPNVDWCEDHRQETLTSNLVGTLNVATCCAAMGIHLTVFATGCERLFPNICHVQLHWLIGDRHLHVQ